MPSTDFDFNKGVSLTELIDGLPPGLDRAVLRVLAFHTGRKLAISRVDLVKVIAQHGFPVHERALRACINLLRKNGQPICSTGGDDGGYWLAANWDELNEYLEREIHSRAMDLLEQEQALKASGEKLWGKFSPEKQGSFF
jgi:hypothetical protein